MSCTEDSIRYHYKKLLYGPQNTTHKLLIVLKQEVYNVFGCRQLRWLSHRSGRQPKLM